MYIVMLCAFRRIRVVLFRIYLQPKAKQMLGAVLFFYIAIETLTETTLLMFHVAKHFNGFYLTVYKKLFLTPIHTNSL